MLNASSLGTLKDGLVMEFVPACPLVIFGKSKNVMSVPAEPTSSAKMYDTYKYHLD